MHSLIKVSLMIGLAWGVIGCTTTSSQEAQVEEPVAESFQARGSVRPGINDAFTDAGVNVATWAERWTGESREVYNSRLEILAALNLEPGDRIADIGAGTGLYVKLFAETVGDEGGVFAVDISQPFLEFIAENAEKDGLDNVSVVLGEDRTSNLPDDSVDILSLIHI